MNTKTAWVGGIVFVAAVVAACSATPESDEAVVDSQPAVAPEGKKQCLPDAYVCKHNGDCCLHDCVPGQYGSRCGGICAKAGSTCPGGTDGSKCCSSACDPSTGLCL